jgi:hypothetical protein
MQSFNHIFDKHKTAFFKRRELSQDMPHRIGQDTAKCDAVVRFTLVNDPRITSSERSQDYEKMGVKVRIFTGPT